jgi:hypothetical protein
VGHERVVKGHEGRRGNWGSNFGCLATGRFEKFSPMLSATRGAGSSLHTAITLVYSTYCGVVGTSWPVGDVVPYVLDSNFNVIPVFIHQ